jgi:hypothetical protein
MPVAPRRGRAGGLAPREGGPTWLPVRGTGLRQGPGLLIATVFRVAAVSGGAVIGHGEAGWTEWRVRNPGCGATQTRAAASHLN